MAKEFFIRKADGVFQNIKAWQDYCKTLDDGKYKITIQKAEKRSLLQNGWFHAVLPEIVKGLQGLGYGEVKTPEDAKDVVKAVFFKKKITNGVETIEVIESTSEQTKIDFSEKADEIIQWALEYLGINIAPPSKQFEVWE